MPLIRTISSLGLSTLLAAVTAPTLHAQLDLGGYAGAPIRAAGLPNEVIMGGTFGSISPDASAVFVNSAYLPMLRQHTVSVAHSFLPFGQKLDMIGYGFGSERIFGFGVGISRYGLADVEGRTLLGERTGNISSSDMAFSVGGGLTLGPAAVGATIRYLRRDLTGVEGGENGYTVDLSGVMMLDDRYHFSFSVNNIAGGMVASYDSGPTETIPWNTRIGFAYLHPLQEPREEIVRTDPTGKRKVNRLLPDTYLMGAIESRMSSADSVPIFTFALESVPSDAVDVGLRFGLNTLGDLSFGTFVPIPFERDLRIDMSARSNYGSYGDLTYHLMITLGF